MPYTRLVHSILTAIMLLLMSVIVFSCNTTRQNWYDDEATITTRHARTPDNVWGKNKNKNKSNVKKRFDYEGIYGDNDQSHQKNTNHSIEQWKKLDIKLGRHDNKALYKEIKTWLGTPYASGEHKKQKGTDCSGFVMEIYLTVYNMKIERSASRIYYNNCYSINCNELQEGDLVFFHGGSGESITHVGIYLKDYMFAHASSSRGVVIDNLTAKYYTEHFYAAGRVR